MSIFSRNPNEAAYVGGKKHWADVIKNTGPADMLVWRQPEEDFNTNSTLIVMPGEEAVFINGGIIEQIFENGTYALSTNNYPFISRLRNAFTGGISTFNCVVFFVKKTESAEIIWGTDSPIQVRDKAWGIRTEARIHGAYRVRIDNSTLLLKKIMGGNASYHFENDLNKYFRNEFQGKIKTVLSHFLNGLEQELIGIDSHLEEYSETIRPQIDKILHEYGLGCIKFTIAGLDIDTEKYDQLDVSQIELMARKRGYQGDKVGLEILGDDWAKIQSVGILKDLANNPGGAASVGAGLGAGIGAAGAFGNVAQQFLSNENTGLAQQRSASGNSFDDPVETISKLKKLLDAGLIDQQEYDAKKEEILKRM